ncbi:MAG: ATP synthase F1 subunit delta [Elusimicrobia bacterium RIFOXYA2_FULL_58_8]|nr:MAG: ATP synthase F1 subunit delta [Elusimicrobia bacterium RIFOXYA12_FULL_57_11]OGS14070.1 MAG: ATP synthase F1 subunit delta [Elusimicrobia bacterium RIFOXYA2_FULL_58_8]
MDSSARILAKRYARAYMDLDDKVFGATLDAAANARLDGLRGIFAAAKPHLKVLTHPAVNGGVKLEVLGRVLGAGFTGPAADFSALLVRQNRFALFGEIMRECLRLYDDFCGVVSAEVHSRYALSAGEIGRIDKLLCEVTGRKIRLEQIISERVIGGFEIKVGDALIDATVRGSLAALKAGILR